MDQHDEMLHTAWADLRGWLDGAEVAQALEQPSVLAGWTVRELIAHLGRAFTTMTGLRPSDEPPLPMLDYVAAYRPVASGIATATRKQAAEIEGDVLLVVDQLVADGLAGLAQTTAEVVQGPRGPI
ncbi:MAG: maleylpyruvate isomerase N-terminal domain-containing protein, partial [Actinomycetota bacterium]|nr:maleylpyruvate isomerase N-terminal domain-containing protein [Actinomycetota bacterium]